MKRAEGAGDLSVVSGLTAAKQLQTSDSKMEAVDDFVSSR